MNGERKLEWDWYPGTVPENVLIPETAYAETSFSFRFCQSRRPDAVHYGRGASTYLGTMFDLGENGRVRLGDFALVHGARIICDTEITIGDYALISWNVVLMDTYRLPMDPHERRKELERIPALPLRCARGSAPGKPVRIERNVWIGFEACVLPGVTVGEGSVVGARSVVAENVPPFTIVAGNPARTIREITHDERQSRAQSAE